MQKSIVSSRIVMISPESFCSNPETADSNAFQKKSLEYENAAIQKKAKSEHQNFLAELKKNKIDILSFVEKKDNITPDALFLNNWFCHLPDGKVILFPMFADNRKLEYRSDLIDSLGSNEIVDLRYLADQNEFLEGTGSLILDHENKLGYACLSVRTTLKALQVFSEVSGYKIISFTAKDINQRLIYHTNVMMALSPKNAVINLSSIVNLEEKLVVIQSLKNTGHHIIDITQEQMNGFVGNMIFLKNSKNDYFWVCSTQAYENLTLENKKTLELEGQILHTDVRTIETYGGGGARCMIAEVFN